MGQISIFDTAGNDNQPLAAMKRPSNNDEIVVNAIAPGPTSTSMINKNENNISKSQHPLDRYIMPEEIANLAVFLVSSMGKMIVGDTVYMSGGLGVVTIDDLNY